MKNVSKKFATNDLLIDVVEYMFIEWLVRQGIFAAFKSNYTRDFTPSKSFRKRLRIHIQCSLRGSGFGLTHLVSSSFLFSSTPEGVKFWMDKSAAWERFCTEFQVKL